MDTVTALVLCVPEADPHVGLWRADHDPAAMRGMPAHVTVAYPFMPLAEIDAAVTDRLQAIFSRHAALRLCFADWRRFPGVLYLAPEPAEPIAAMSRDVMDAFPDWPLYGGAFPAITPHLTVAHTEEDVVAGLMDQIPPSVPTPIHAIITACTLFEKNAGRWQENRCFPLRHS